MSCPYKSTLAAGLIALISATGALAGPVLPDDTKLVDLPPDSIIRFVKPLKVCSGQAQSVKGVIHSGAIIWVKLFRKDDPPCKTIQPGSTIRIGEVQNVTTTVQSSWGGKKIENNLDIDLADEDSELSTIEILPEGISSPKRERLTIEDLRRVMGWKIWIERGEKRLSRSEHLWVEPGDVCHDFSAVIKTCKRGQNPSEYSDYPWKVEDETGAKQVLFVRAETDANSLARSLASRKAEDVPGSADPVQ